MCGADILRALGDGGETEEAITGLGIVKFVYGVGGYISKAFVVTYCTFSGFE